MLVLRHLRIGIRARQDGVPKKTFSKTNSAIDLRSAGTHRTADSRNFCTVHYSFDSTCEIGSAGPRSRPSDSRFSPQGARLSASRPAGLDPPSGVRAATHRPFRGSGSAVSTPISAPTDAFKFFQHFSRYPRRKKKIHLLVRKFYKCLQHSYLTFKIVKY